MDYKQEQFMRMQQYQYAPQMPFFMGYPIQNMYMAEIEYDRDMERMKELYPQEAKRIQHLVEEECDKMEYDGSMMFDEYPDRTMLKVICDRIYEKASGDAKVQEAELVAGQAWGPDYRRRPERPPGHGWPPPPPPERPHRPPRGHDQGLGNLIEVLLYHEMYKRRCRHNRCRRWW